MRVAEAISQKEERFVSVAGSAHTEQMLSERMQATFSATLRVPRVSPAQSLAYPRLQECVDHVTTRAPLYFKQHIPIRPLRLLVRKLARRIVFPFLWPQVEFNEAVRDGLIETRGAVEQEADALRDALQKIRALEEKVELLEARLSSSVEK